MKEIDALGLACPMPVLLTKREIEAGESLIVTRVDNTVAVGNLTRLGESMGYSASVEEESGSFKVLLTGNASNQAGDSAQKKASPAASQPRAGDLHQSGPGGWTLLVTGDSFGRGSEELGSTLMTMFFYTLTQSEDLPASIVFLNGGVKLPTESAEVTGHLKALEQRGCEVLVCGTCLNYYGLQDALQTGIVSNMYEITLRLQRASKVVSL